MMLTVRAAPQTVIDMTLIRAAPATNWAGTESAKAWGQYKVKNATSMSGEVWFCDEQTDEPAAKHFKNKVPSQIWPAAVISVGVSI